MNLLFRQYSPEIFSDKFSVYTDSVLVDGQFKTQYIAEMYGEDSGRYAIEETDSYIKALRILASFKKTINNTLTTLWQHFNIQLFTFTL